MPVICVISCNFLSFMKKVLSSVIKSFFTFTTNDNHFTPIIGILQHKMYSCFELSWNSKYIMALTHWQLTTFNVFKVQKQVLLSLNPKPKQNHKYHPTCITFDACTVSWETSPFSTESSVFIYLLFRSVRRDNWNLIPSLTDILGCLTHFSWVTILPKLN